MSSNEVRSNEATGSTSVVDLDMKLEVVVIPVSDVDHAKKFYSRLGWRLDADRSAGDNFRLVQFTPPGSGSSIQFGVNLTSAAPGSAQAMLRAVSDTEDDARELVPKLGQFPTERRFYSTIVLDQVARHDAVDLTTAGPISSVVVAQ